MSVTSLSKNGKTFLAGAIKGIILADGRIDEFELEDMDVILKELEFTDFDSELTAFENKVKDMEQFWLMSDEISNQEERETILSALYTLSVHESFKQSMSSSLYGKLLERWKN